MIIIFRREKPDKETIGLYKKELRRLRIENESYMSERDNITKLKEKYEELIEQANEIKNKYEEETKRVLELGETYEKILKEQLENIK